MAIGGPPTGPRSCMNMDVADGTMGGDAAAVTGVGDNIDFKVPNMLSYVVVASVCTRKWMYVCGVRVGRGAEKGDCGI
jgi:hypothetical protein